MREEFITASKNERIFLEQLFKQRNVIHYEFSDVDGYDNFDTLFTASTGTFTGEVKCRNNDASAYTYSTIIELSKIEYLLNTTKGTNRIPIIIIFFQDGFVFIKELDRECYYNWNWYNCKKTTVDGNEEKIPKKMVRFIMNKKNLYKLK